ncbi:MAG: type II secretion system F family protein [Planctomycetes bacterium]|nr:type II secretion system F family protein [Planctomycetota bacterium]
MQVFEYAAADARGQEVTGVTWARSEEELDKQLGGQGLVLTRARVVADERQRRPLRIAHAELVLLTTQLATVTSAGVPLLEGLSGIRARVEGKNARALLGEMISALEAGEPLSKVMEAYPRTFPSVYRASVVAGESSGALDKVLVRLAAYMEWVRGMRATTLQALIYPSMLMLAVAGLIGVLLFFLLPRLLSLFPGGVEDLPAQTRFVLGLSNALRAHVVLLCLALGALAGAAYWGLRTTSGRAVLDRVLLSLPVLGKVARSIATSKFASTAAILQSAGCDVFTVLEVSGEASGNAAMGAAFTRARERVRSGSPLSEALEAEPLADKLLIQLVAVGEKSGALDRCLERVAAHYDNEIPRSVKRMLALLEPALLLFAGGIVAFILLAALLPMFDVLESMH